MTGNTEGSTPGEAAGLVAAARELVARAAAEAISVRLLGGVAIWIRASAAARAALGRHYPDIDLVARKRQSRDLRRVLEAAGYQPERVFNATHGARRLLYHSPDGSWHVDVFLDVFEMSHTLDFGSRLETEPDTLPAADLLLSKLQIAEINHKDLSDVAMLLWDHEPGPADGPGRVSSTRLAQACGDDWGLCTTVSDNLARAAGQLAELPLAAADRDRIAGRVHTVAQVIEDAPKSVRWRVRARVGRRVRWYEVPEEVVR